MTPDNIIEIAQAALNLCIVPIVIMLWNSAVKLARIETDVQNLTHQVERLINRNDRIDHDGKH